MNNEPTPEWMQDDLVKDIPPQKLDFLKELFANGHGKSQKELMMTMLPLMKKAKADGLSLTPQELNAAIAAIKKYSSASENEQINNILNKASKKT